jgi:murein L,D-transpeptidase YcbB/YkuD
MKLLHPRSLPAFIMCFALAVMATAVRGGVSDEVRKQVLRVESGECVTLADCPIASRIMLPALYEKYRYQAIWNNPDSVSQLLTAIEESSADGLDPEDYHRSAIQDLQERLAGNPEPELRAQYDLLLSDSLIRLGYHLLIGKVDPVSLDGNWNMGRMLDLDVLLQLSSAIDNGAVDTLITGFRPQAAIYHDLKRALSDYRHIRDAGGWPAIPDGDALKPGMQDPRVQRLRERLVVTGDLQAQATSSEDFDAQLDAAVRRFQARHGLAADGVVGAGTLAELNLPVEQRIDQLRVNLERARWVLHDLPNEFVMADIAGFRVRYVRDGEVIWDSRAQVGRAYRKTPVFRDRISYIEFNPTWTVPPTILRRDILPAIKRDPGYLQQKDMVVLTQQGAPVDPAGIDWTQYPGKGFPYLIRQQPGLANALGRVKFMFPNKHLVYLHDTPSKSLFERSERAFSSGCVRIEHPFDFAELLLEDKPGWDRAKIMQVVDSRQITRVNLDEPVTVILLYWTAAVGPDSTVHFKKDIYARDGAVLDGLNREFSFRKNPVIKPGE